MTLGDNLAKLPTGVTLRGGVFQLRIGAPKDLQRHYGVDAWRGSLRTTDRATAIRMAHAKIAELHDEFERRRAAMRPVRISVNAKLVDAIVEHLRHKILADDDLNRASRHPLAHIPLELKDLGISELAEDPLERLDQVKDATALFAGSLVELASAGEYAMAKGYAGMATSEMGLPAVDWTEQPVLLAKMARSLAGIYQQVAARAAGELIETPPAPTAPIGNKGTFAASVAANDGPAAPNATTGDTLRDVVPDWVARTRAKTNAQQRTERALTLWEAAVGNAPLTTISRATGAAFVAYLLDPGRPFGSSTAANHAAAINALMNMAVKVGKAERNPLDLSFKITDAQEREYWTDEELRIIFDSRLFGDNPGPQPLDTDPADARLWLLQLLWSGAPAGEIAQARVEDVQRRDGILCLRIARNAGTVKTDARERWLPIAEGLQPLYAAQLEARRHDGKTVLFPSFHRRAKTDPADMAGRWFRQFREAHGLPPGSLMGSHRFRHTVSTRLAELGVGQEVGDQITGHSSQGSTRSRVYTGMIRPAVLAAAVERLAWQWPAAKS